MIHIPERFLALGDVRFERFADAKFATFGPGPVVLENLGALWIPMDARVAMAELFPCVARYHAGISTD